MFTSNFYSVALLLLASGTILPTFATALPPISPQSTSSRIQCHASAPTLVDLSQKVLDPRSCLSLCGPISQYHSAIIRPVQIGEGYDCLCVPGAVVERMETEQCSEESWYAYSPYLAYDDDGDEDEQNQERVEEQEEKVSMVLQNKRNRERIMGLCDGAERACQVLGQESSYECVDVRSAIQMCGGCVAGEYLVGGVNTTSLGSDCTAFPGVAEGGVECIAGQCIISGCSSGFYLSNGRCVRT